MCYCHKNSIDPKKENREFTYPWTDMYYKSGNTTNGQMADELIDGVGKNGTAVDEVRWIM